MKDLEKFIKNNEERHEIFHEGYRRGVIDGFTEAINKSCAMMKILKEIRQNNAK